MTYAQHITHERASTRPEFDDLRLARFAQAHPLGEIPDAGQLAKHLADFGRRDKIALSAEHVAVHVISTQRVQQHLSHKVGYRHRSSNLHRYFLFNRTRVYCLCLVRQSYLHGVNEMLPQWRQRFFGLRRRRRRRSGCIIEARASLPTTTQCNGRSHGQTQHVRKTRTVEAAEWLREIYMHITVSFC